MPVNKITISEFMEMQSSCPTLDVRSPGEFQHARIPGALSFPLFDNNQRAEIGTTYKQVSRESAIKIGLGYFGGNLVKMVEEAERIVNEKNTGKKEVNVHCWRGGMRSAAVAWLLDLYGFRVNLLSGGYKAFRQTAIRKLAAEQKFYVLGGFTGSNKTGLIQALRGKHAVIDLEALAGHKGSAFGNLDNIPQPSQEFFENLLATALMDCEKKYPGETIWLEGESQRIGNINTPKSFSDNMKKSRMVFLKIPFEQRLDFIVQEYGAYSKEKLIGAILRIKKRLGGLETKNAINFLIEDDVKSSFALLLRYYDKYYLRTISDNEFKDREIIKLESDTTDPSANLKLILKHV